MARNHARIYATIWADPDFLALTADAQRLYMLLLSQPNLSHCGLLPLTVKRWAQKAADTHPSRIEAGLDELADKRFVVLDYDTEELLIRSFIRGDEVYRQPNVLAAASKDAVGIASPALRAELLAEIVRISSLSGLTERVTGMLGTLAGTLRRTLPAPTGEPQARTTPRATGMGSVTEVSTGSPSPTPSPTPATVPATDVAIPDDPTGRLMAEHAGAYSAIPPPSALTPVRREVMRLVAEKVPEERIRAGLARLREKRLAASLLPQLVTETTPVNRASTTDQRVAQGLALVARYEEAGE